MLFILVIFVVICFFCAIFEKIVTPSTQTPSDNYYSHFMHKCNEMKKAKQIKDLEVKPPMSEEEYKRKYNELMVLLNK